MVSYVITEFDPTYGHEIVVGVFDDESKASEARQEATQRMDPLAADRGVFYRITVFVTNKLYH